MFFIKAKKTLQERVKNTKEGSYISSQIIASLINGLTGDPDVPIGPGLPGSPEYPFKPVFPGAPRGPGDPVSP